MGPGARASEDIAIRISWRRRLAGAGPDESAASATASYQDNQVLKFTQDGQFLMQIGKPRSSKGSNDLENLRLPAKTFIDKQTNEVYVADGYGNHRVIVYDANASGKTHVTDEATVLRIFVKLNGKWVPAGAALVPITK